MNGLITGEKDSKLGLSIFDNNHKEHLIELKCSGEIEAHSADDYESDPRERPLRESEHINQVERFARYCVYHRRECDAVKPWKNPDKLIRTIIFLSITSKPIKSEFEDLYHQLRSHTTGTDPVVPLPEGVIGHNITYKKDVYIRSPEELQSYIDFSSVTSQVDQLRDTIVEENSVDVANLGEDILETVAVDDLIQTTSGLQLHWDDATGQYQTRRTDEPDIEREPDARIELLPFAPDSLDELHIRMIRNLFCQVRDRYVGMGVTPPEPFRVQGLGAYDFSTWYDTYDFYQRYHDPDATIDWLAPEPEEHRRERDDDFYY
ncbi:hypothetical protein RYH80_03105 [Halobaculum sp. MBLA0147]|uniref:hypothetical protein n=1 Tax=Halobaculum sp. MBLA0147 TaxID=3079934 RepID=UPI003523230A